ncbi:hypothetical protein diail_12091 [Diaporthe ilicicola]|nr:hypothetical protein diail_12091 [Diaporthe ilicicola]
MGRSSRKRHKQSRHELSEPLMSTRGVDGLWQSIERDEEDLTSCLEDDIIVSVKDKPVVVKEDRTDDQDTIHRRHQLHENNIETTSSQGAPDVPPAPDATDSKTSRQSVTQRAPTPTRADLLARVLNCPLPHPDVRTSTDLSTDTPQAVPSSQGQTHRGTKRRRGRPKKPRNAPNWNRPRRVRFSDPIATDREPQAETRDPHVFVRLLKLIVILQVTYPARRQEFVWNNRARGWRLAGERSERNIEDIAELFDDLSEHGSLLRVLLAPTEGRGAREPVEMAWDDMRCCFQGTNQEGMDMSVALGEMKDMVRNPWARQFVGYILG